MSNHPTKLSYPMFWVDCTLSSIRSRGLPVVQRVFACIRNALHKLLKSPPHSTSPLWDRANYVAPTREHRWLIRMSALTPALLAAVEDHPNIEPYKLELGVRAYNVYDVSEAAGEMYGWLDRRASKTRDGVEKYQLRRTQIELDEELWEYMRARDAVVWGRYH